MAELKPCPFDNRMCMCQFCKDPCNNGLNCHDCNHNGKIMHTTYICTGFVGDQVAYLKNLRRAGDGNYEDRLD